MFRNFVENSFKSDVALKHAQGERPARKAYQKSRNRRPRRTNAKDDQKDVYSVCRTRYCAHPREIDTTIVAETSVPDACLNIHADLLMARELRVETQINDLSNQMHTVLNAINTMRRGRSLPRPPSAGEGMLAGSPTKVPKQPHPDRAIKLELTSALKPSTSKPIVPKPESRILCSSCLTRSASLHECR